MHALLEELLQILDKELAAYRALLKLLRYTQEHILGCRASELAATLPVQDQLHAHLAGLDRERHQRVLMLAERLGLAPEERTTSGLSARLADPYRARLLAYAAALRPLMDEIRRVNDDNRYHLRHACDWSEHMLRVIAAARGPRQAKLYGQRGQMRGPGARMMLSVNRTA